VALVRTKVSEELIAYIIQVTRISELGKSPILCDPDDGDDTFFRNVGSNKAHAASQPRIQLYS
jgi:hypothetical protein